MPNTRVPADGEAMPAATIFLAVTPTMRLRLATTIENLIALLDEIDGDENTEEPGDAEPWLAWPERGLTAAGSDTGDRELDYADDEDGADAEPEETDHNGDEGDFSMIEDDGIGGDGYDGSGVREAKRLLKLVHNRQEARP